MTLKFIPTLFVGLLLAPSAWAADISVPNMPVNPGVTTTTQLYCPNGTTDYKCSVGQVSAYFWGQMSQDCTASGVGVITCTKTNNVPFSSIATLAGAATGDIAYWNGSSWARLAGNSSGTSFLQETSAGVPSWAAGGSGAVSSVSAGNTSLTISPITGAVSASLNVGNANTWSAVQTFGVGDISLTGAGTGCAQFSSGILSGTGSACGSGGGAVSSVTSSDSSLTISPTTGLVVANLNPAHANTWTGVQTFGTLSVKVRSLATTPVTISATTDYFLCLDPTSNAITATLPASPATGLTYLIKDCTGQAAAHNITISPASGNIDGSLSYIMSIAYQSVAVTYTGSQWSVN